MASVKDLHLLYDYCYWANAKILAVVSKLNAEEFIRPVAGSYGSIRNTLVHTLSAEWGWLDRCGGARRGPKLVASDYPTVASVTERWKQVEAHLREFLGNLQDRDLDRIIEFSLGSDSAQAMPLGQLMHHAALHGIHHRGQVALLLRELGQVPGNIDILMYYGRDRTI